MYEQGSYETPPFSISDIFMISCHRKEEKSPNIIIMNCMRSKEMTIGCKEMRGWYEHVMSITPFASERFSVILTI